jgi:hypothetical protein
MRTLFAVVAMGATGVVGYVTGAVIPPPGMPTMTREQPPPQAQPAQPPQAAQGMPPGADPLTTSQHDIPWYMAHDAERKALRQKCIDDEALARTADCANAQSAENRISYDRKASETGGVPLWNRPEQKR